VQTIDSLASRIVRDASDHEISALTFEQRIVLASKLVQEGEWLDSAELEHIVVDEVQDVVGVRADFLIAILDAIPDDAGFTLLGDPAQAIYDFQLAQEGESATTSVDLLESAGTRGARTIRLKGQYRATSRETQSAANLRGKDTFVPHHHDIEDFWNEVVHLGTLPESIDFIRAQPGSTAFLTSTNGQALAVANELRSLGLTVGVLKGTHQQVLAGWIGKALAGVEAASLTREEFFKILESSEPEIDPVVAWRALRSVAGGRGRDLNLLSFTSALETRTSFPPDLLEKPSSDATVSTVHRAKGLEFENVVLVEFPDFGQNKNPEDVRSREQFVALTRARKLIVRVDGPDTKWVRTIPGGEAGPRWIRGGHKHWMTTAIEIRPSDIDLNTLGMGTQSHDALVRAIGSEANLVPSVEKSTLQFPVFEVFCNGALLGTLTEEFGQEFASRTGNLEKARRGWPRLSAVAVEGVTTIATSTRGFRNGLILAPVLSGLAQIEWND